MIAIIDVTGNNLTSLTNAIQRLGFIPVLTHCPDKIKQASYVILPGVGAAKSAMNALYENNLVSVLKQLTQPVLGICLGMQLLYDYSEEGNVDCLGLLPGAIKKLGHKEGFPVPHMGWNQLRWCKNTTLKKGVKEADQVYFVHSYAAKANEYTLARCQYNEEFTAVVQKDNIYGMQFHPEKSAETGLQLLTNFLSQEDIAC